MDQEPEKQQEEEDVGGLAQDHLRQMIDRIERLEEEKEEVGLQIRAIYAEAKSAGFEPKVMRTIIRDRKKEPHVLEEEETLIHLYKKALGMSF
ncbi:MAG: DUF2312 domain-containing protein [Magnetococcales bacterium]|nr:DUF2312 domain-containing protein [Magnetococcales bacterium]